MTCSCVRSRFWWAALIIMIVTMMGCQSSPTRGEASVDRQAATPPFHADGLGDHDTGALQPETGGPPSTPVAAIDPTAALRHKVREARTTDLVRLAGLPEAKADPNSMVAHFIDVGQGDATLLEFSCAAVLIDTGGETTRRTSGRANLKEYLEAFFDRRADLAHTLHLVVLSHPHKDHTDGVETLLGAEPAIVVLNVLDNGPPGRASGAKGQRDLQAYAQETEGVGYVGLKESDIKTVSGVSNGVIDPVDCRAGGGVDPDISALWGRVDIDQSWVKNGNNSSIVLRVSFGESVFLFMGDLESHGIAAMLESYSADLGVFDADVLKVGHHGSHNATSADLVAAVTPAIAVIQSGDSSPIDEPFNAYVYAHPHITAVELLLDEVDGVTMERDAPKRVRIGTRGKNPITNAPPDFTYSEMRKAIYANGWDGNIAVRATVDGELTVESEY